MKPRALVLVAMLLHAGAAQAAPPRAPVQAQAPAQDAGSAAVTEAAKARFGEGVKAYAKKRYDRALAAFLQAYALTKNPAILFNLGMTSLKLGDPLHAVRYFEQFLHDSSTATPDQRARADAGISTAKQGLGSIDILAPDGAEVAVDGEPVGRAPHASPVAALPGEHAITITTSAGAKLANVEVKAGMVARVKLAGSSAPPPSAVPSPSASSEDLEDHGEHAGPRPAPPPPEPTTPGMFSPPDAVVPAYVAGAIGLGALGAAVILRGIGANADRNTSVALDTLHRNNSTASACTGTEDASLAITCSSLRSAVRATAAVKGPFVATLAVGTAGALFALGWYFFAPKTAPRVGANGLILTF